MMEDNTPKLVCQIVESFGFEPHRVQAVSLSWRLGEIVDVEITLLPEFEGLDEDEPA